MASAPAAERNYVDTMERSERRGRQVRELVLPCGGMKLWSLSPRHYLSRVWGQMTMAHAELFIAYAETRIASNVRQVAYHDWFSMTSYEPGTRLALTKWAAEHMSKFDEIHIGTDSRMVAMGVTVANLALSSFLRAHRSREHMCAGLGAELSLHRILI